MSQQSSFKSITNNELIRDAVWDASIGDFTIDMSLGNVEELMAVIEYFNGCNDERVVHMSNVEGNLAFCTKHWRTMTWCGCHENTEEPDEWYCVVCNSDFCKRCDDKESIQCDRCEYLMCSEECKALHKC